jgi:hypothetical protein
MRADSLYTDEMAGNENEVQGNYLLATECEIGKKFLY